MITISSPADLAELIDQHLGYSDWVEVTQDRVDLFAEATGDHQWIHVDVERAKDGPFGGTIAHGYLTLSLAPALLKDIIRWENIAMGVNYGLNKVRFPAPVPVGSKIRAGAKLLAAEDRGNGSVQVTIETAFEVDGKDRPACVAELLLRYTFNS